MAQQNEPAQEALNPALSYLRVVADGRIALLVLGYVEPDAQGDIEVWYSAKGEVVRLQNGRLKGTTGLSLDWREVRHPPLPAWGTLNSPFRYTREHDEMPKYRYGVRQSIVLEHVPAPKTTNLKGIPTVHLTWFVEREEASESKPPSLYAVHNESGSATVVYGEQCLSDELCLSWQRWPPTARKGSL